MRKLLFKNSEGGFKLWVLKIVIESPEKAGTGGKWKNVIKGMPRA